MTLVRLEPAASRSRVKHSDTSRQVIRQNLILTFCILIGQFLTELDLIFLLRRGSLLFIRHLHLVFLPAAEEFLFLWMFDLLWTIIYQLVYRKNRGSYMSAHVLLNLLNELGKRDKMRGLPSILSLFRNKFNKFNNTRARMLDSIYHMTLRLLWNLIFAAKML